MEKINLINKIRKQAIRIFDKDVVKIHYANERLMKHKSTELLNLLVWFNKEIDIIKNVENREYMGR